MAHQNTPRLSRSELIEHAHTWIGTPYRHQASEYQVGCDCLGFIRGLWRKLYGSEAAKAAPYSRDWDEFSLKDRFREAAECYLDVKPLDQAYAGDVVFFRWRPHLPIKHCALLVSETTMIHAYSGARVVEATMTPFWRRKCVLAGAFPKVFRSEVETERP